MLLSTFPYLHDKHVVIPSDMASNNIVFVCKSHFTDCLTEELVIANSLDNPIYIYIYIYIYPPPPRHLRKRKSWKLIVCSKDEELE